MAEGIRLRNLATNKISIQPLSDIHGYVKHRNQDGKRVYLPAEPVRMYDINTGEKGRVAPSWVETALDRGHQFDKHHSWGDRADQFREGLAQGIGDTVESAYNLASKVNPMSGVGDLVGYASEGVGKASEYVGEMFKRTSPINQNLRKFGKGAQEFGKKAHEFSDTMREGVSGLGNDVIEATGERNEATYDDARKMFSTAGEFTTDLLPLAAGTKLLSAANTSLKSPTLKKAIDWLGVEITGKNAALFAGAGAGQGYVDRFNKHIEIGGKRVSNLNDKEGLFSTYTLKSIAAQMIGGVLAVKTAYPIAKTATDAAKTVYRTGGDLNEIVGEGIDRLAARQMDNVEGLVKDQLSSTDNILTKSIVAGAKNILEIKANPKTEQKLLKIFQGGELDKEVVRIGEKHDLVPTPDMLIKDNANVSHFRSYLESGLVDSTYRHATRNYEKKISEKFTEIINNETTIFPIGSTEEVGQSAMQHINHYETSLHEVGEQLFKHANSLEGEKIPIETEGLIKNIEKILPKSGTERDNLLLNEEFRDTLSALKNGVRSNNVTEHRPFSAADLYDKRNVLSKLAHENKGTNFGQRIGEIRKVLDKEINKLIEIENPSSEFLTAYKEAMDFKIDKSNKINRNNFLKTLIEEDGNKFLKNIKTSQQFEELGEVLPKNLIGEVKKAKLNQMLGHSFEPNRKFNADSLAKIMREEENLMRHIIGDSNYVSVVDDFIPWMKKFNNSQGEIFTLKDIRLMNDITDVPKKVLISGSTGAGLGSIVGKMAMDKAATGAIYGAIGGTGKPLLDAAMATKEISRIRTYSRIFMDPKFRKRIINREKPSLVKSEINVLPTLAFDKTKTTIKDDKKAKDKHKQRKTEYLEKQKQKHLEKQKQKEAERIEEAKKYVEYLKNKNR